MTGFKFACCKHGLLQAWSVIERDCRHAATIQDRPANQEEEGDDSVQDNSVTTTPGQGAIPQSQNEAQEPTQYYEPAQPPAPAQGQSDGVGDPWNNLERVDPNQWSWQPHQVGNLSLGDMARGRTRMVPWAYEGCVFASTSNCGPNPKP